jgi:hypothetical protein
VNAVRAKLVDGVAGGAAGKLGVTDGETAALELCSAPAAARGRRRKSDDRLSSPSTAAAVAIIV